MFQLSRTALVAVSLIIIGIALTLYQHWHLGLPWDRHVVESIWTIEAKIGFKAKDENPVKVNFTLPSVGNEFVILNESFISRDYGLTVSPLPTNRYATWSIRRANGRQNLYYRVTVARNNRVQYEHKNQQKYASAKPLFYPSGAEKIAMDMLLKNIRSQSSDIATFTSEAIKMLNQKDNNNAKLLVNGNFSGESIAASVVRLLSMAHINAKVINAITLEEGRDIQPSIWIASHDESKWLYFNIYTGVEGLPQFYLPWGQGHEPLVQVDGGINPSVHFSVTPEMSNTLELSNNVAKQAQSKLHSFSLFSLPIHTQQIYQIIVMVPLGVFVILLLRVMVGLETLGTFMPVLIALAFRETELIWGILLFSLVTMIGLSIRAYLDKLKLLIVPRLSIILTMVVVTMIFISVLAHKLDLDRGLSIALFPMVILTMTIERMAILWEEQNAFEAIKIGLGSLVAAVLAYAVMIHEALSYLFFAYPSLLLVLMANMVLLGRYRGYRLLEVLRFKEFFKLNREVCAK